MKLLICLGNFGCKYEKTRHNVGFMFADMLASELGSSFTNEPKFKAELCKSTYKNEAIWIVKPQTYMNLSGEALLALKNFYKIDINDLFIVYDDISLELGKIRFRNKGSDGGHNGIKSIIKQDRTGNCTAWIKSSVYQSRRFASLSCAINFLTSFLATSSSTS